MLKEEKISKESVLFNKRRYVGIDSCQWPKKKQVFIILYFYTNEKNLTLN